jgi:prepilin-type N-terminal cleavage/methylation domain-containing protein
MTRFWNLRDAGNRRCRAGPRARAVRAFTMLELVVVVVVLGILAILVIPRFIVSAEETKKNACEANTAQINLLVERWYFEKGSWPQPDLSDIGAAPEFFPTGLPKCPVDGRSYMLAPNQRVTPHVH